MPVCQLFYILCDQLLMTDLSIIDLCLSFYLCHNVYIAVNVTCIIKLDHHHHDYHISYFLTESNWNLTNGQRTSALAIPCLKQYSTVHFKYVDHKKINSWANLFKIHQMVHSTKMIKNLRNGTSINTFRNY